MKTFWLSFAEEEKGFLGVVVIEIEESDVAAILEELNAKFPNRMPGSEWVAAATRRAHNLGCNPGGQVASWEIPECELYKLLGTPRDVLLSEDDLQELGHI